MLIEADFSNVPDVIPKIGTGIHDFLVESIQTQQPKPKTDGKPTAQGVNIVVKLKVNDNTPDHGRYITHYIFISSDPGQTAEERQRGLVPIKRLALAAGVQPGTSGLNILEIQGKTVKADVVPNIFKNNSGQTVESTAIGKFFIPGDPELAGAPSGPAAA
jgi:hypothetical protein